MAELNGSRASRARGCPNRARSVDVERPSSRMTCTRIPSIAIRRRHAIGILHVRHMGKLLLQFECLVVPGASPDTKPRLMIRPADDIALAKPAGEHSTSGVLPVPPNVRLPTLTTGTPTCRLIDLFRDRIADRASGRPTCRESRPLEESAATACSRRPAALVADEFAECCGIQVGFRWSVIEWGAERRAPPCMLIPRLCLGTYRYQAPPQHRLR